MIPLDVPQWQVGDHVVLCADSTRPDVRRAVDAYVPDRVHVLDPPFQLTEAAWLPWLHDPSIVFGTIRHALALPPTLVRFERVVRKATGHRVATTQLVHEHALVIQVGSEKLLPATPGHAPRSVIAADSPDWHRWGKPAALIAEHLTLWTPPGVVVDPFAGGGSAAVAAHMTGRPSVSIELDRSAAEAIVARLAEETSQPPVSTQRTPPAQMRLL